MTNLMSDRARVMRREPTPAEKKFGKALRLLNPDGYHFRRQAPLGPYIADFAEMRFQVIVECDGEQHTVGAGLVRDVRRDAWFSEQGFTLLRFANHDVLANFQGVMEQIIRQLGVTPYDNLSAAEIAVMGVPQSAAEIPPHPGPPPQGGRESETVLKQPRKRRQRALPDHRAKLTIEPPQTNEVPSPLVPLPPNQSQVSPSPLVGEGWGGGEHRPPQLRTDATSAPSEPITTELLADRLDDSPPRPKPTADATPSAALTDAATSATSASDLPERRRVHRPDET